MKTFYIKSNLPIFPIKSKSFKEDYEVQVQALEVNDDHHTFTELYNHHYALFCALVKIYDNYITPLGSSIKCWKSKLHDDETMFDDSFIVGMTITKCDFNAELDYSKEYITYHLPLEWWDKFKVIEYKHAPKYDGHTSEDVIERLLEL